MYISTPPNIFPLQAVGFHPKLRVGVCGLLTIKYVNIPSMLNESTSRGRILALDLLKIGGSMIGISTIFGYVLLNFYLAQMGYFENDIFQYKAFASGLLFSVLTLLPVALLYAGIRIKKIVDGFIVAILVLGYLFLIYVLSNGIPRAGFSFSIGIINISFLLWQCGITALLYYQASILLKENTRNMSYAYSVSILMTVFVWMCAYSFQFIDNFLPAFGGMKPVIAEILQKNGVEKFQPIGKIRIMYQNSSTLLVKGCGQPTLLKMENVENILYYDFSSYSLSEQCKDPTGIY